MNEVDVDETQWKRWKPSLLHRIEWHLEIEPETRWLLWPALAIGIMTVVTLCAFLYRGGVLLLAMIGA